MRRDYKLVQLHFNSSIYDGEIVKLPFALNDDYNIFSGKNQTRFLFQRKILKDFFPQLVLVRSLQSSFIDSFSFAKKRCNTSQGFGSFFVQSCDRCSFPFISFHPIFFFLFLDFIVIRDFVFNKTIILLGLAGYQSFDIQRALVA